MMRTHEHIAHIRALPPLDRERRIRILDPAAHHDPAQEDDARRFDERAEFEIIASIASQLSRPWYPEGDASNRKTAA